jgi:hypothetical protein
MTVGASGRLPKLYIVQMLCGQKKRDPQNHSSRTKPIEEYRQLLARFQLSIFPAATLSFAILGLAQNNRARLKQIERNPRGYQLELLVRIMHRLLNKQKRAFSAWPAISPRAEFLIGGLMCALAAFAVSALAAGHSWQVWIPLCFSAVLLLTALIFGTPAGLLGSVLAALVFTLFLFSPTGKISIADQTARTNLGWMMLTGVAFSFLFGPPSSGLPNR